MRREWIRSVATMMFITLLVIFTFYSRDWLVPKGDFAKTYLLENEQKSLEYSFNNKDGKYKAIHYTAQIHSGDFKFIIIDENNEIKYESAWNSEINRIGKVKAMPEGSILGIGNACALPQGTYKIRFEIKGKTNGGVYIKWKI